MLPTLLPAQTFDAGIRHGILIRLQKDGIGQGSMGFASGQTAAYEKILFVRMHSNKLMYEIAACYHQYKTNDANIQNNVFATQYSLHYDITYPGLAYIFPFLRNMRSYAGVSAIPTVQIIKNEGNNIALWSIKSGIHYTRIIPITRHINFSTQLFYITGLTDRHQSLREGNLRIGKSIGFNTSFSIKL